MQQLLLHAWDSGWAPSSMHQLKQSLHVCRAFLAKGIVLKDIGRKGDAQRVFLQARCVCCSLAALLVQGGVF